MTWWDLSSVLSDLYYSQMLEVTWHRLMVEYKKMVKDLFIERKNLESKNEELRLMRLEEINNKKALEEKKLFRERLLDITMWQEEKFREYIERQIDIENKIKSDILRTNLTIQAHKNRLKREYNCDINTFNNTEIENTKIYFEDTWSEDDFCYNFEKVLSAEIKLLNSSNKNNNFLWPIIPERWLSAYYLDENYEKVVWATHDAIDIRAKQWTDIVSPADWYVIFIKPPVDESYSYFAIKHADWFVSFYGHVNEIYVWMYDFVWAWQIIAKSWWEIWTKWAWLMTTWPHLHFWLFKDEEYVDPLDYLDLTYLWIENLPKSRDKYIYKFLEDYKTMNWYDFEWELPSGVRLFTLKWETEVERQIYLLNNYATPEFRNWDMWVEESLAWNIDPSFVMCIWLAETSLWRSLKTAYNVWNVWNTDSWSTRELPNARSWIYWIVRTLNNRFLWDYETMDMLSRYWNPDGPIYASSSENWQRNMVRCLSALKWTHIPDDYRFRLNN